METITLFDHVEQPLLHVQEATGSHDTHVAALLNRLGRVVYSIEQFASALAVTSEGLRVSIDPEEVDEDDVLIIQAANQYVGNAYFVFSTSCSQFLDYCSWLPEDEITWELEIHAFYQIAEFLDGILPEGLRVTIGALTWQLPEVPVEHVLLSHGILWERAKLYRLAAWESCWRFQYGGVNKPISNAQYLHLMQESEERQNIMKAYEEEAVLRWNNTLVMEHGRENVKPTNIPGEVEHLRNNSDNTPDSGDDLVSRLEHTTI